MFHKAIALNDFIFKIKRRESPNCSLCDKNEETLIHLFCECEKVTKIWHDLRTIISQSNFLLNVTNFEKLFGFLLINLSLIFALEVLHTLVSSRISQE